RVRPVETNSRSKRKARPDRQGVKQMPSRYSRALRSVGLAGLILTAASASAFAQKKYDTGVTDTTIKIGNTIPYSGPASAYGIIGKTMSAYMHMINSNRRAQ